MSTIIVRVATEDDVDVVADMTCSLAQETESVTLSRDRVRADVQTVVKDVKEGRILVAEAESKVIGFVLITGHEWSQWHYGRILWLASAYVEPAFRRKKVGQALYDKAVEIAKSEGAVGLRSYEMLDNTMSIQAQLRYGMKLTGYVVMEHLFTR